MVPGTKAALGDTRLVVQQVAQRGRRRLRRHIERTHRRDRLKRLQHCLLASGRGDRDLLADRRYLEGEVHLRLAPRLHLDAFPLVAQAVHVDNHLVGSRRHVIDPVAPLIVGLGLAAYAGHQDIGMV